MAELRYLTHPEVVVDAGAPVDRWGLSDRGRARGLAMLDQPWVPRVGRIVSSAETKAVELARLLGSHLELEVELRPQTGENNRSATGFVPPSEFEQLADRFFSEPSQSVRGWERAVDAQMRIVGELEDLLDPLTTVDVAVIGHGAVGTLWFCALACLPIDRKYDQPGQGHFFTVDLTTAVPRHGWRAIDELEIT